MARTLEKEIALQAVAIAKGQSVGRIPVDTISSDDYVQRAITDARRQKATFEEVREAVQKGLRGRPNPSLN